MRVRLRQSDPRAPGFRRVRHGRGFRYFDAGGTPVADPVLRLARRGLVRERVLACAARLLDFGFFRIGSDQYAQTNGTYGLTTVLCLHVDCQSRETVAFDYPAKGGKRRVQAIVDEPTRKTIAALPRGRGTEERLLAYRERRRGMNGNGTGSEWHEVHSDELNAA